MKSLSATLLIAISVIFVTACAKQRGTVICSTFEDCLEGQICVKNICTLPSDKPETAPVCGNLALERGEECDRGSLNSNDDICTDTCKIATCGDGLVYKGIEECDEGAKNSPTGYCLPSCKLSHCGDARIDAATGEECDDGVNNGVGACTPACKRPSCGDFFVSAGEDCDAGPSGSAYCTPTCHKAVCGDRFVSPGEECDDGPLNGNDSGASSCTVNCTKIKCGDGIIQKSNNEECDDGAKGSKACTPKCTKAYCGDRIISPGEECDNGADNSDSASVTGICTKQCQPAIRWTKTVTVTGGAHPGDPGTVALDELQQPAFLLDHINLLDRAGNDLGQKFPSKKPPAFFIDQAGSYYIFEPNSFVKYIKGSDLPVWAKNSFGLARIIYFLENFALTTIENDGKNIYAIDKQSGDFKRITPLNLGIAIGRNDVFYVNSCDPTKCSIYKYDGPSAVPQVVGEDGKNTTTSQYRFFAVDDSGNFFSDAAGFQLKKYSAAGTTLSTTTFPHSTNEQSSVLISTDKKGNLYLSEYYNQTVFLRKLDANLNVAWQRALPEKTTDFSLLGMLVDKDGYAFLFGRYREYRDAAWNNYSWIRMYSP